MTVRGSEQSKRKGVLSSIPFFVFMAVGSFQRPSRQGARQNDTFFLKKTFDAMSQRPLVGAAPAAAGKPGAPSAGTAPELEDLDRKRRSGRRCARAAARRTAP
jgi:hypothetical protein